MAPDHHPHDHDHHHDEGEHHHPHHGSHVHAQHPAGLGHAHAPASYGFAFAVGIGLNVALVIVQVIVGYRAHSLALMADAGHNFADVLGLVLTWGALVLQRRRPTQRHTYGMRRSSVLAALVNAIVLLVGMGALTWEAIGRFHHASAVDGLAVIWVAAAGIVVNGISAALFLSGSTGDLNIRSAFLHLASDAVVSLGVVIAGAVILWTGWLWVDPIVTLAIVVVIVVGTWSLFRESLNLALDAAPAGMDMAGVRAYLLGLPGVTEVHDLHVWGMSTTETALTAHVVCPVAANHDDLLDRAASELQDRFAIGHVTIQIEVGDGGRPCRLEAEGSV
ncbi:MAG: cation transporter [Planctomycetes bacterium]|nr:cation transporter [Planctomycetota bacterium]